MAFQQRLNSSPNAGIWKGAATRTANAKKVLSSGEISASVSFYAGDFQLQIDRHLLVALVSARSPAVPKQARADRWNLVSCLPTADVAPGCARARKRRNAGGLSGGRAGPNHNRAHQSQRRTGCKSQRSMLVMHGALLTRGLCVHPVRQRN